MPQKVIKFTGINRKINEFNCSGESEELINLRLDERGGLGVVKPKHVIEQNIRYSHYYVHSFGDTNNHIAIIDDGPVVWLKQTEPVGSVFITRAFVGKNVSITSAGNVLLVYCEDEKKQLAFRFENEKYVSFDIGMKPIIDARVAYITDASTIKNSVTADASTVGALNEAMGKAASGFYNKYPNGLCGLSIIGCTYELKDGSEIWSTAFVVADSSIENSSEPTISGNDVTVYGARRVFYQITLGDVDTEEIKSINVYATRPVFPYEVVDGAGELLSHSITKTPIDETNLAGQVMFYMGSLNPKDTYHSLALELGKELPAEDIMDVTAGCIERVGDTVSYNNRFHYYRSETQHVLQVPTVSRLSDSRNTTSPFWVPFVKFDNKWYIIKKTYKFSETLENDYIYPLSGVEQLAFVKANVNTSDNVTFPYDEMFYVDLKDSSAYNYSYAFKFKAEDKKVASVFLEKARENGQAWDLETSNKVTLKKETNAINVSAQFNPFVFPVEYSYSFSGEIKDITTSYLPISSTQVGQYPITVFTSNGIFALEQGNGSVLYSNIVPLQPQVIEGKATATPYGTFFVSSRNLYALMGRETINISSILNGDIEENIRNAHQYTMVCGGYFDGGHNFINSLSKENFEDFIANTTLVYDQLNNELIISSNDEAASYSYVFSLNTKSFHKIDKRYLPTNNGARYLIEVNNGVKSVVDSHTEEDATQHILLQSRPIPLEAFFTHIQRLILLLDTKLDDEQKHNISLLVFGSDDLDNWKAQICTQKRNTSLRQIRTNKAFKSFRDYVFIICGVVDTNSDISELIADYTVTNRRLG